MSRRGAERESFATVQETCPDVHRSIDEGLAKAAAYIADGVTRKTGELRAALTEAIRRAQQAEGECEDLKSELARTQSKLEEALEEITSLRGLEV